MAFEMVLFATNPVFARAAVLAGVDAILIDWEFLGKEQRQYGADTQINHDTAEDLSRIRTAVKDARVIVRLNRVGATTAAEVEEAVTRGADEILLPMITSPEEVERVFDLTRGRCEVGILIETLAAVRHAAALGQLPLRRVFMGLNDLALERGSRSIFEALIDGTVEEKRGHFAMPFGFGGLTLPDRGAPIPARLLIGEIARQRATWSFLRRNFYTDVTGRDVAVELPRIRAAVAAAQARLPAQIETDRQDFVDLVKAIIRA